MRAPRLYIVAYDIADPKRWRRVFRLMHGYGDWLQLSVFQCRLDERRHAELAGSLNDVINTNEDHVLIMDMGLAENVEPRVVSLGKAPFEPVQRQAIIV